MHSLGPCKVPLWYSLHPVLCCGWVTFKMWRQNRSRTETTSKQILVQYQSNYDCFCLVHGTVWSKVILHCPLKLYVDVQFAAEKWTVKSLYHKKQLARSLFYERILSMISKVTLYLVTPKYVSFPRRYNKQRRTTVRIKCRWESKILTRGIIHTNCSNVKQEQLKRKFHPFQLLRCHRGR